ncbi:hypothetical protein BUE93_08040 [Chromobacterium amazonense]|uniref:Uncharacterized protein n=2 Tax=Chromobacterium amazonense TaxID=1382803 RepID=A0A2S9X655_9NEIS|nr:hypothetical protein BUE93_08040 [Chromobacterium amazonense]
MQNATLTVLGANGQTASVSVNSDGSYSNLDVSALTAPFRLQACGLVNAVYTCHYAVAQSAGTANVTSLTTALVTLASGSDAANIMTAGAPSASALSSSQQTLQGALSQVLAASGLNSGADLTTTAFSANRTGMDKVLDAIAANTGTNNGHTFVQLEGRFGSSNFYVDNSGSQSGSLSDSTLLNGLGLDLTSISQIFSALNSAASSSSSAGTCATVLNNNAGLLDPQFTLSINQQSLNASNFASSICGFLSQDGLLGGSVANPTLRDCDFSGSDKTCTVGFDVINGSAVQEGAEMAVVLRNGATAWKLLGQASPYEIHVNANVQRTLRVGVSNPQPSYYRAISFDISTSANGVSNAVQSAKVYQRNAAGTGWDSAPIATLSNAGCASQPRLTMQGSSCGSTWLGLDGFNNGNLASGDALISAFFQRGRQVKIDLYSDNAFGSLITSVFTRVDGVPPQSSQLAALPWLTLDSASQSALANYASAQRGALSFSWTGSNSVVPHDASFCNSGSCNNPVHIDLGGKLGSAGNASFNLSSLTLAASDYKMIALYGRDRSNLGFESNYVSCVSGSNNCP